MRPRRALLFMPGDDAHKIGKAIALQPDAIIMDLEDGVALGRKAEARAVICAALADRDFGRSERLVRINPLSSPFAADDLEAILPARPDGLMLPKVESADEVLHVAARLDEAQLTDAVLVVIVESARGVVMLREIAASSRRIAALCFGAEDLAGDIGAERQPDLSEAAYARGAVVVHAHAYGLQAIDTPFITLNDEEALRGEAARARALGYTGKLAIHPRQIGPITEVFTPDAEAVAQAQRLIALFEHMQAQGTGAFSVDGRMVDMPMIRAAQALLARAALAGLLPPAAAP